MRKTPSPLIFYKKHWRHRKYFFNEYYRSDSSSVNIFNRLSRNSAPPYTFGLDTWERTLLFKCPGTLLLDKSVLMLTRVRKKLVHKNIPSESLSTKVIGGKLPQCSYDYLMSLSQAVKSSLNLSPSWKWPTRCTSFGAMAAGINWPWRTVATGGNAPSATAHWITSNDMSRIQPRLW